ncbi:hypothetical protein [Hoeflea sp.]|uniref:hypothetical protein n=1 Tax=Hoeflea sp. TaxID=1940281 RepID=UPI003B52EFC4
MVLLDYFVIWILRRRRYFATLGAVNLMLLAALMAAMAFKKTEAWDLTFGVNLAILLVSFVALVANLRFLTFVVISDSRLRGLHIRDRRQYEIEVTAIGNRRSIVLLVLSYMGALTSGMFFISTLIIMAIDADLVTCVSSLCKPLSDPLLVSLTLANFLDQSTMFTAQQWAGVPIVFAASLLKLVLISLILPALLAYREGGSVAGAPDAKPKPDTPAPPRAG